MNLPESQNQNYENINNLNEINEKEQYNIENKSIQMKEQIPDLNSNSFSKNNENTSKYITDYINENDYQKKYMDKVQKMENLIGIIKNNAYEKQKREYEERLRYKNELENNVEILSSYIKMNRVQKKNFSNLMKTIDKEKERISEKSYKVQEEQHFFNRELPYLRGVTNKMQNEITKTNEETKNIKNQMLEIDRDIMALNDGIKQYNKMNSNLLSDNEKLKSSVNLLKKHIKLTNEKVFLLDKNSEEFFTRLTFLAKQSEDENKEYENKKNSSTIKSSKSTSLRSTLRK